ncbi:MAG: hypothetical protein LBU37_15810 [Tannerellaceae bacterium]|nr:hypothetical protein [Tannerellaceae bacterium]
MKKNLLLVGIIMLTSLHSVVQAYEKEQIKTEDVPGSILDSIQYKIEDAMYECFSAGNTEPLNNVYNQLNKIKPKNNIVTYWMVYVNYYQAVFLLKSKDKKESQTKLNEGITLLEKQRKKNAEDYALLALLQSFSIQFKSGMAAGVISSKVVNNAEKSIELDPLNLRAWYVLASNDFYTPEGFGGGKNTETYLKKAISISEESHKNLYLPNWGREYAYDMLIRFYIKKDKLDEARETLKSASLLFPNSYMIKQYEDKLKIN